MKNLPVACLFLIFLSWSVSPAESFLSGIFGGSGKTEEFVFRTFFEGDWKLQKKTAAVEIAKEEVDVDVDDRGEEDDIFGDVPSDDVYGEAGDAKLDLAFYSLRSDNLTNSLVGSYYEEEAVSKERTRRLNVLKLHVKYDRSGNSGSFLTGEFNDNDNGVDADFDVLDEVAEDPAKSNMATLFDFNFKTIPALTSDGGKRAPTSLYMSEGYWHGNEETSWYQFIVTRPDQFILTVHPILAEASTKGAQATVTIVGTKYFGKGAVGAPTFYQKYFPTMMIIMMMLLRHLLPKPTPGGARNPGAYRNAMHTPGAERSSAGVKEPTKENQ